MGVALRVGQGEVGEIDLVGSKRRCRGRAGLCPECAGCQAAPEEGELITKVVAGQVLQVAGVIPPFGLEVEVRAMIAGKFKRDGFRGAGKTGGTAILSKGDGRGRFGLRGAGGEEPEWDNEERGGEDEADETFGHEGIVSLIVM